MIISRGLREKLQNFMQNQIDALSGKHTTIVGGNKGL